MIGRKLTGGHIVRVKKVTRGGMASTPARSSMLFSGSHADGQIGWIAVHQEAGGTPRTWHAVEGHLLSLEASQGNIQARDLPPD